MTDVVLTFPSVDEFHDVAIQVKRVVDHLHRTIHFAGLIRRKCVFFLAIFTLTTVKSEIAGRTMNATLGTRGFSRVRREVSVLAEGRHVFGRRPKPRAAKPREKPLARSGAFYRPR